MDKSNQCHGSMYNLIIKQLKSDGLDKIAADIEEQIKSKTHVDEGPLTGNKRKFSEIDDPTSNQTNEINGNKPTNENDLNLSTIVSSFEKCEKVLSHHRKKKQKKLTKLRKRIYQMQKKNQKTNSPNSTNSNNEKNNSKDDSKDNSNEALTMAMSLTIDDIATSSSSSSDENENDNEEDSDSDIDVTNKADKRNNNVGNNSNSNNNSNNNNTNSNKRNKLNGISKESKLDDMDDNDNEGNNDGLIDPKQSSREQFGNYECKFETKHKTIVSCLKFSYDGEYAASASMDGIIKLYSVDKMRYGNVKQQTQKHLTKSNLNSEISKIKPLIRQYSTKKAVNELDFHPLASQSQKDNYIACCNDNGEILFFNFHKQTSQNASILICENFGINTISYHGSGDYILAGGNSSYVRLYDIRKQQGYIGKNKNSSSDNYIKQIRYQPHDGNVFASCSMAGDIRLYDSRNMQCVNTLAKVHENKSIHSIEFGKRTRRYLLSHGKDNIIRLWDLRNGKQVTKFLGIKQSIVRSQARFSYDDKHIITSTDYKNNARILVYDCSTGDRIFKFRDHKMPVTWIEASPNEAAFITCGMDCKVKFFAVMEKADYSNNGLKSDMIGDIDDVYSGIGANMGMSGLGYTADAIGDAGLDSIV